MEQSFFEKLLNYYSIDDGKYLELTKPVSSDTFATGHQFDHINEAVNLVNEVMKNNGKIFIYGDYDADGIMGTSILVKMFKIKNYEVEYYIPSRYIDSYGLTSNKAQECIDKGIKLVICVDNGITAFEGVKLLKDNGVKVLILDHHEALETLPEADYILHPTIDHFGETASSGGFIAFNFSRAFLGYFDKYLSTLAAISVVSDMMPLLDYNRELLRIVFNNYKEGEFLQLDLLRDNEEFSETTIGMRIAPKINSIGRVITDTSINDLVKFFITDDKSEMLNYINWINETNELRKSLSRDVNDDSLEADENSKGIVYVADVKEGIIGLMANSLLNKYHVPVVVLTRVEDENVYKGSARAPEGFNLLDVFKYCSDHLVTSGGHASAGGCTVKGEELEQFKNKFIEFCNEHPIKAVIKDVIDLKMTELNSENYHLLKTFAPFGEAWPNPIFELKHVSTKMLFFSKNREHIITQLSPRSKIVGFGFPMDEVRKDPFIDLIGTMRSSTYMNVTSIEFNVKKIKVSDN